jgi:hypothetical protein
MITKIFAAILFLSSLLIAQPILTLDSIAVKISNDTAYVWDYNAWEQCGFQLYYTVEIQDSVITIIQIDTAKDMTTCYGYHNFVVPVTNLKENRYRIDIFRDALYQDNRFIKSFWFEYHHPGWEENIILYPDSVFLPNFSKTDSCKIINNSNLKVNLDSIYNKSYSSYYCKIKKGSEYYHVGVNPYKIRDTIHLGLNPSDTILFIIEGVDVCPICKKQFNDNLKDTLVFVFTSDSGQTEKSLSLNSDIPLDVEDHNINVNSFYLSQNFPNQFNQVTLIKYSIPQPFFVELKIYDVLGKVIATLVNERKSAGDYSIGFNTGNLPSGVYFYRMQAITTGM